MSSSTSNSDCRRYLGWMVLFTIPILCVLGLNALFLERAGDALPLPEVVRRQGEDPRYCLYGDALHGDTYQYKLEGLRQRKPAIVALGSSRVMQFRERFFTVPFHNMGGAMNSINEGGHIVEELLRDPKPQAVLLGIDFWWLGETAAPTATSYRASPPPPRETGPNFHNIYFLFKPFQWLWDGKITAGDYVRVLRGNRDGAACNIGIMPIKNRTGFGPDGSHYDDVWHPAPRQAAAADYAETLGKGLYAYEAQAAPLHAERLIRLIRRLQEGGIDTMVFFPPFAPSLHAALQEHRAQYGIFEDIKARLHAAGIEVFDASDPALLRAPECEFIDGIHGSDVTYARLLLALDKRRQEKGLQTLGATAALEEIVARYGGYVLAPDPRMGSGAAAGVAREGCIE